MTRVLVLADIGQSVYHAGDEAMGHAAADALASRALEPVVLTLDADHTRARFGDDCATARTLTFPWGEAQRELRLAALRDHLTGHGELPPDDPARALISTVDDADGVLIAGGGNLNSRFGWLLYERAALAAIAEATGTPLVISGQTLGPALTDADADTLTALLGSARRVGVRDPFSAAWARGRGLAVTHGVDDAAFLTGAAPDLELPASFLCVTAPVGEDLAGGVAALLDHLADRTGWPIVLLPHMADPDGGEGDLAAHRALAGHLAHEVVELPVLDARQVVAVTARASLVVTSRYHPAVFAGTAGVPVLGIAPDAYTQVRLDGALGNLGLSAALLPAGLLGSGWDLVLADAVLERADAVRDALGDRRPALLGWARSWWDAVAAEFTAPAGLGTGRSAEPIAQESIPEQPITEQPMAEQLAADVSVADVPVANVPAAPSVGLGEAGERVRVARDLVLEAGIAQANAEVRELRALSWDGWRSDRLAEAERDRDDARAELDRVIGSRAYRAARRVGDLRSRLR